MPDFGPPDGRSRAMVAWRPWQGRGRRATPVTVLGTIRFLVGAALVAAGVTLVAPLATRLVAAARQVDGTSAPGMQPAAPVPAGSPLPMAPVSVAPAPLPPVDSGMAIDAGAVVEPAWADASLAVPDSGGGLQLDRSPPPPPAPLPPSPPELVQASPALGAAYRSTLEVPPPPLLDTSAPPPASMSWATPGIHMHRVDIAAPPAAAAIPDATVPATYRVVDGDDLGTIAGRFYGYPGAAAAIWSANRETIPHPDLLPIGAELRLPRPWAVQAHGRAVGGAIEPVAFSRPVAPAAATGPATPARVAAPWLDPAMPVAPPPPMAVSAPRS